MCVGECRWDLLALDYEGDNAAELSLLHRGESYYAVIGLYFLPSTDYQDLYKKYSKPIWIKSVSRHSVISARTHQSISSYVRPRIPSSVHQTRRSHS